MSDPGGGGRDRRTLLDLLDYSYWATYRLLDVAAALPLEQWRAAEPHLTRSLRSTLVHELDVEWSWRGRLMGGALDEESELDPDSYETVESLAEAWRADEREMRGWLAGLSQADLESPLPRSLHGYTLGDVVLHVLVHGMQQRSDAAAILTRLGHSPGELEFLDYLDARRGGRPAGDGRTGMEDGPAGGA